MFLDHLSHKKSNMKLVIIDIDNTLSDSRPADHLLPIYPDTNFQPWRDALSDINFQVVPGSMLGIYNLLKRSKTKTKFIIMTSRTIDLEKPTRAWLDLHFENLRKTPLSMRSMNDLTSTFKSKKSRIDFIKKMNPEIDSVTIIDDDISMLGILSSIKDRFIHISDCNWDNNKVYKLVE